MQWYVKVMKNYVGFSGRAHRTEFWMFALINFIIGIILGVVDSALGFESGGIGSLYSLVVLLPSLAVGMRRLHDTDRSGWWLLLYLIPILGWIALLIFYCLDGTPGSNQYGPDPKQDHAEAL